MLTALEYLNKLTCNGSKIRLPGEVSNEVITRQGNKNNFINIKTWNAEKERIKKDEEMLERVTAIAFNVDDPRTFYNHIIVIVPPHFRGGEYDEEKWTELLSHIVLEISSAMFKNAYSERFHKSSTNLLTMLQNRVNTWQKKATISAKKNSEDSDGDDCGISVQVNIN